MFHFSDSLFYCWCTGLGSNQWQTITQARNCLLSSEMIQDSGYSECLYPWWWGLVSWAMWSPSWSWHTEECAAPLMSTWQPLQCQTFCTLCLSSPSLSSITPTYVNPHACCTGNIMALEFGSLMQPVSIKHSIFRKQEWNTVFKYVILNYADLIGCDCMTHSFTHSIRGIEVILKSPCFLS